MLLDVNHIIIKDEKQNVILETRFNSTAKDYRTAREMGCSHSLYTDWLLFHSRDRCQNICDDMDGLWDLNSQTCSMVVYIDHICYRLIKNDNKWQLDSSKFVLFVLFTFQRSKSSD